MNTEFIHWLLIALSTYAILGIVFSILFLALWINQFDHAAQTGTWGFIVLILPGLIALWPLFLLKVRRSQQHRYAPPLAENPLPPLFLRQIHGCAMIILAVLIPILATLTLAGKPAKVMSSLTPALEQAGPQTANITESNLPTPQIAGLNFTAHLAHLPNNDEVRLDVPLDIGGPAIAVYWSNSANVKLSKFTELPQNACFLGTLWGPHLNCYPLPSGAKLADDSQVDGDGTLYFLETGAEQKLLGVYELKTITHP